jgi:DNA-binding Lrp family transcriptional regulator
MNSEDRRLLASIQDGIPLTEAPFRDAGTMADMSEEEVLSRLTDLARDGTIRRFGARINHVKLGILANAMVCWNVPDERVGEVGMIVAGFPGVTHCYERETLPGVWDYNLFCVIHERSEDDVSRVISDIENQAAISGHVVLFSRRKFKHTPAVVLGKERP